MEDVVRVLMHGAEKYGEFNWADLDDFEARYITAAQRHLVEIMEDFQVGKATDEETFACDVLDAESGLPHAAHVIANMLFLLARDSFRGLK